ncbi:MAG: cobalt-precorrin-5B (C(1))-methyltransferase [Bacteroidaceae bacterium]|nr:cobalt-precorrin-5B (C(1))-methyltransferase [Bacteroidaceae bacterium]
MILVFGGTTEGRRAAAVLEQAGSPYYYSTRGSGQEVELVHGVRLSGTMDTAAVVAFCREKSIRLIVDAAHPFAEQLHRNLLVAAEEVRIPLIRYDRIYPPHTDDITWCSDYADAIRRLEDAGVRRLLALTGVQTIGRLKPYWQRHDTWFRILDRDSSREIAAAHGFPQERLLQADPRQLAPQQQDAQQLDSQLLLSLRPEAILTKESGISGGFVEKVEAAKAAGIKVFVIEAPLQLPPGGEGLVNGPHGLRRMVEQLLPDFFPLRSGLTTGTCATAAAVAALCRLQTGATPPEVPVRLPDGETICVPVGYARDYAFCIKDAGDDPDVTNGAEVQASLQPSDHFEIRGGEGVGRFTLPGFDYPPGEAAINRGPRQMLRDNIPGDYIVTISVRGGAELARRTFNPRLGIEGGISVIGVSGIVQPYSEEAFLESIHKCMEVACASGAPRIVLGSGAKSEDALRALYPELPPQAFVQYGNFVGRTLCMATDLDIRSVTLGVMLGKAVKLAAGQLDTHSRHATFDREFIRKLLDESHCDPSLADRITLVRELWDLLPTDSQPAFVHTVLDHCRRHCRPLFPDGDLTLLLIDDEGHIHPADCDT